MAPFAAAVFGEVSERVYGGLAFGEVGERAPLRVYPEAPEHVAREALPEPELKARRGEIRLVAYKPLFSGAAVERVEELQFQRPRAEVELSRADAQRLGIETGDEVTLTGGGASVTLRARVSKSLGTGIARVAREFAGEVRGAVDVKSTNLVAEER